MLQRSFIQVQNGFEIFTYSGKQYLFKFIGQSNKESIVKNDELIKSIMSDISRILKKSIPLFQSTSYSKFVSSLRIKKMWRDHLFSNFEYIMLLNILSGRSFLDPSQYPIFPWLIFDTESQNPYSSNIQLSST